MANQIQTVSRMNEHFTPKDLVSVPINGKLFLHLYPKRDHSWSELENNLAFNINSTALQNSSLKKNIIINALAEQMDTSPQVTITLKKFEDLAHNQYYDPNFLSVVSYHSKKGTVLENATIFKRGKEVLQEPILRPNGIHFVKLKCKFDFSSLGVSPFTQTSLEYYAKLPITSNLNVIDLTPYNEELSNLKLRVDRVSRDVANLQASLHEANQTVTHSRKLSTYKLYLWVQKSFHGM